MRPATPAGRCLMAVAAVFVWCAALDSGVTPAAHAQNFWKTTPKPTKPPPPPDPFQDLLDASCTAPATVTNVLDPRAVGLLFPVPPRLYPRPLGICIDEHYVFGDCRWRPRGSPARKGIIKESCPACLRRHPRSDEEIFCCELMCSDFEEVSKEIPSPENLVCMQEGNPITVELLAQLQTLMQQVVWPDDFLAQCVSGGKTCNAVLKDDEGRVMNCVFEGGQVRGTCTFESKDAKLNGRLAPDGRVLVTGSCPPVQDSEIVLEQRALRRICKTIEFRRAVDCERAGFSFALQRDGSFLCAFEVCPQGPVDQPVIR